MLGVVNRNLPIGIDSLIYIHKYHYSHQINCPTIPTNDRTYTTTQESPSYTASVHNETPILLPAYLTTTLTIPFLLPPAFPALVYLLATYTCLLATLSSALWIWRIGHGLHCTLDRSNGTMRPYNPASSQQQHNQ
ncbi:hypothetical protein P153DRAFT_391369 [Dothidotthia symphoricarpi CBS 119687]|uniref:Uncharacterized protein n=1 Tax=Dothidotthia symphoricarpi CBS 119687 TaxID=1392245 RepID=A0A6A5ZV98_9PLEO|nr:uncharacterized protein P153DRAFT_391369 [Dothidotthia symphoricarpi CBS 119687]KAF2123642.1 hypothetical protein P153DRAFT_391369 [Dothidotthia symphoricarpi CBS 119687]